MIKSQRQKQPGAKHRGTQLYSNSRMYINLKSKLILLFIYLYRDFVFVFYYFPPGHKQIGSLLPILPLSSWPVRLSVCSGNRIHSITFVSCRPLGKFLLQFTPEEKTKPNPKWPSRLSNRWLPPTTELRS